MRSVDYEKRSQVAPLVGARIEILIEENPLMIITVAPLVGARIEISPLGLMNKPTYRRSPRGSED